MSVLVTGAAGFVGNALVRTLLVEGYQVSALVREFSDSLPESVKQVKIGDLALLTEQHNDHTDRQHSELQNFGSHFPHKDKLAASLDGVDTVVHLAARVHIMNDMACEPLMEFRRVNVEATLSLARLAAQVGVKRFVFLSSIKVNGESTPVGLSFTEQDSCNPTDPYGISKWEAEQGLRQLAKDTGMEVVIIRPPLIYGPGVKGNFSSMMRWIGKGVPLPLGAVSNQRSLVALDNLISFIILCLKHPKAANELFLLADGEDVSTSQLIRKLSHAMGKKARLLPIPVLLMKFVARLLGKKDVADRLFGNLQIDSSKARELLNWQPVVSIDEQFKNMVE